MLAQCSEPKCKSSFDAHSGRLYCAIHSEKCRHGVSRRGGHCSKCPKHLTVQCAEPGCKKTFLRRTNKKYCAAHARVCRHDRKRTSCRECGAGRFCEHNQERFTCWHCNPLGWARQTLTNQREQAKRGRYIPAAITAPEIVELRRNAVSCPLCLQPLEWDKKDASAPHLHHDHRTGKVYGYTHGNCNFLIAFAEQIGITYAQLQNLVVAEPLQRLVREALKKSGGN